ncbi:MAG: PDZ domain-containing protein, partial [Phycisphaeraceae bacterium]|nr:PDZ domain-containing protein [Phycisphaeraceae bacterium]
EAEERPLVLGARPRPDGAALLKQRLGLAAEPVDEKMARALGLDRPRGLVVTEVADDGPAAAVGLQRGDLLLRLGRREPRSLDRLGELLETVEAGDRLTVTVLRVQGRIMRAATVQLVVR